MGHKYSIVGLLLGFALFAAGVVLVGPAPHPAYAQPAGTPIGDTPSAPFRIYLPLTLAGWGGSSLPADLTTTWVYANMRGFTGGCIPRYEELLLKVCVRNQGAGDAGPFDIRVEDAFGARTAGLKAGGSECLETVPATYGFNPITVKVDSRDEVAESDEDNNAWTGIVPLPTAPLLCTATPTPLPPSTPTP